MAKKGENRLGIGKKQGGDSRVPISAALKDVPDPRSKKNPFEDHIYIGGARIYPGMALVVNLMRDPRKGKVVSPNDFNPFAEKPQKIVLNGRGNARRPQGGIHQTSPQVKGHDEKNHRTKARKITERKLEKSPNGLTSKVKH